ncbi:MAG: hypothetical protein JWM99_2547 [Verrucomicrobiales bacterium]|nr:hypothetical protein [Verrucomicrobiales bacterium]
MQLRIRLAPHDCPVNAVHYRCAPTNQVVDRYFSILRHIVDLVSARYSRQFITLGEKVETYIGQRDHSGFSPVGKRGETVREPFQRRCFGFIVFFDSPKASAKSAFEPELPEMF